ncbi:hypothetical protein UFOVP650_61 [uncultured Caudovirales phage]|uniref:Uncharacterized protein n=1 Tax=uncultured Caudovirales phage TaxID=2100421 RepID=A0A6J5NDB8_9CAUD|nr:hypothetical protein UFOVP650_61 [uncultured Caudovirales phage]
MSQDYDVRAKLILDSRKGQGQLQQAAKGAKQLQKNLAGASREAGNVWGKIAGLAAGYVGLNAMVGTMARLTSGAVSYTAALEKSRIGLTSILAAVENTTWEKAAKRADIAFEELKQKAVESPATPQELFGIFNGIVGPIEAAGYGMQKVLDLTTDTVSAASALDVDFQQAQRDITMMVRGAAGMDVKMFSLLRSTGAIAESTEDWNQKLTGSERVEKLSAALSKFRQAGERYGKSWAGVTSTFHGITQEFGRSAFTPIMAAISTRLDRFNTYLIANQQTIGAWFENLGNRAGSAIGNAFDRAEHGFKWVLANWDTILDRVDSTVEKMKKIAPVLALAYAGRGLAGKGLDSLIEGVGGGGKNSKAAEAFAGMSDDEMTGLGFRRNKSGKWIDGAGKFVAGAAGAGVATAGAGGAGAGATAAAGAALGPVTLAIAAIAAVAAFASDHLQVFSEIWTNATAGMGEELMVLFLTVKDAVMPLLKSWGGVLAMVLVPAFQLLVFVFRLLVKGLTLVIGVIGQVYQWIYEKITPAFELLLDLFALFGDALVSLGRVLGLEVDRVQNLAKKTDPEAAKYEGGFEGWLAEHQGHFARGNTGNDRASELFKVPDARATTVNDFRGSRITIKQDFKGNHDPDRIVSAMTRDLARQAESRISSGYSNALSR